MRKEKKRRKRKKSEPQVYKSAGGRRCSMTSSAAKGIDAEKKKLKLDEIMRSSSSNCTSSVIHSVPEAPHLDEVSSCAVED